MNYKRVTRVNRITVALEQQEEYRELIKGAWKERGTDDLTLIRHTSVAHSIGYLQLGSPLRPKLRDLDRKIWGCQKATQRVAR